jgi:hypothetical protein
MEEQQVPRLLDDRTRDIETSDEDGRVKTRPYIRMG